MLKQITLSLFFFRMVFAMHRLIIPDNYQAHMIPLPEDEKKALDLKALITVRNIVAINEARQEITIEASLKLFWKDKRINIRDDVSEFDGEDEHGKFIVMDSRFSDFIWIPDIFVDQSTMTRVSSFHIKPSSIRVYENSMIRYNKRLNFDVACPMDFAKYPVDDQTCWIKFESFSYQTSKLNMTWDDMVRNNYPKNLKLAQFRHHFHRQQYDPSKNIHGKGKEFAFVILILHLKRLIQFHITSTYIPSILLVGLGYTTLYLPAQAVPGRVAMGMLTFLALTTINNSVKNSLPKVSYMTYMDIWTATCIIFVFLTNLVSICEMTMMKSPGMERSGKNLNRGSKIIIPILFILFNAIYWPIILSSYFEDVTSESYHLSQ